VKLLLRLIQLFAFSVSRILALPPLQDIWELARQLKHRDLTEAERREFYLNE